MKIGNPRGDQAWQLLELWKASFGEYNGFWELFLATGFSPERCRCILDGDRILAALTWLDGEYRGEKLAYLYAVATHPAHRGQGLCSQLLEDTHRQLESCGYAAALLLPGSDALRQFYRKFGYETCTTVSENICAGFGEAMALHSLGQEEYRVLRRRFLPENGVLQEGESLAFLARQTEFYAGEGCLLAAYREEETLNMLEYLGDPADAPRVVKTLDCWQGRFRSPGTEKPFVMGLPLKTGAVLPGYFGLTFD